METIIDLIHTEFIRARYEQLPHKDYDIWSYKNGVDYWLIYKDCINNENQEELYFSLNSFFQTYPQAEKNMSVLCVLERDYTNLMNLENIIKIENDNFYFKKYILQYTQKQWNSVKDMLLTSPSMTISTLVMEHSLFEQLKSGEIDGPATLVYAIAHKLPFIFVDIKSKTVDNDEVALTKDGELFDWIYQLNSSIDEDELKKCLKQKIGIDENV